MSQQLLILERELGVTLLRRSTTGVQVTAAGQALVPRARRLVHDIETIRETMANPEVRIAGDVAVGLLPSLGAQFGAAIVAEVSRRYPAIRLRIDEAGNERLLRGLGTGHYDLVVLANRPAGTRLSSRALFCEPVMIVGSPQAPFDPLQPAASWAEHAWVVPTPPNAMRTMLATLFATQDAEPRIAAEVDSLPIVLEAVKAGLGLTLLPQSAVAKAVAKGDLVTWHPATGALNRTIHLCAAADARQRPEAAAVHDLIQARYPQSTSAG